MTQFKQSDTSPPNNKPSSTQSAPSTPSNTNSQTNNQQSTQTRQNSNYQKTHLRQPQKPIKMLQLLGKKYFYL